MKPYLFIKIIIIFLSYLLFNSLHAQEFKNNNQIHKVKLGLNYGQASRSNFLFDNPNYYYENSFFKIQINYLLNQRRKHNFEINIEPSIYFSEYQLLNKYSIELDGNLNYKEQKSFNEYAINIGLIYRCKFKKNLSAYLIGSIGPMISELDTDRLKGGFSF